MFMGSWTTILCFPLPLELGANIIMQSTTKVIVGHSEIMACGLGVKEMLKKRA